MNTLPDEAMATRREVDILRGELQRLDDHGSRGVGAVQVQLTNIVKDVAELKADVSSRFELHLRVHDQDRADRISSRRWMVTTIIAMLAILVTILALSVASWIQLHG